MLKRLFPLFILAAGLSACQSKTQDRSPGRGAFVGYGCIRCHTIAGEGGTYGPDLTFVGFRKSREWLDLWLKNPHGWKRNTVMPNLHLDPGVRAALVDYLSSLKGEGYRAAPPWNALEFASDSVKRGHEIFERAGCVGCHGHAGAGGYPNNNVAGGRINALTYVSDGYSKEELKNRIKNGSIPLKDDPSGPDPMIVMPKWGQVLKDDEIDALADYLASLKPKSSGAADF